MVAPRIRTAYAASSNEDECQHFRNNRCFNCGVCRRPCEAQLFQTCEGAVLSTTQKSSIARRRVEIAWARDRIYFKGARDIPLILPVALFSRFEMYRVHAQEFILWPRPRFKSRFSNSLNFGLGLLFRRF